MNYYSNFFILINLTRLFPVCRSVDSKVPDIGDASSPWETVDKFYRFWFSFKSWREFPHEDEEDVEGNFESLNQCLNISCLNACVLDEEHV